MTVKELIKQLEGFPQELPVYVEDGLHPSDPGEAKRVKLGEDRFYHGKQTVEILT